MTSAISYSNNNAGMNVTLPVADCALARLEHEIDNQLGDADFVGVRANRGQRIELGDFDLIGHQVMLFAPG
jgi:hypothetical protein